MLEYSGRHRYRDGMYAYRLRTLVISALLLCAFGLAGCAYSIGIQDRRLPEGYTLVAVPIFKNQTQEVGVEVPFTNAIIREFARSQIATVVDRSNAQVILEGTLERIQYDVANQLILSCPPPPITEVCVMPNNTILNSEYRISVWTRLVLKRASDGKILWSEAFTGQKSYLAPKIWIEGLNSANALYNHSSRQENLSAMAIDIMAEAHGRLTENF